MAEIDRQTDKYIQILYMKYIKIPYMKINLTLYPLVVLLLFTPLSAQAVIVCDCLFSYCSRPPWHTLGQLTSVQSGMTKVIDGRIDGQVYVQVARIGEYIDRAGSGR